jgi:hypothetical protein
MAAIAAISATMIVRPVAGDIPLSLVLGLVMEKQVRGFLKPV